MDIVFSIKADLTITPHQQKIYENATLCYLQDTARQERQSKERLSRENDILIAEKFTLEQSLAVSFNFLLSTCLVSCSLTIF